MRGSALRLRDQMLGAAKADFEPHVVDGVRKQRAQIGRRRFAEIERRRRQQRIEQRRLPRLERVSFAAAEERARDALVIRSTIKREWQPNRARAELRRSNNTASLVYPLAVQGRPYVEPEAARKAYFTALRIASARSVLSQEKPPSLSGARPKWP